MKITVLGAGALGRLVSVYLIRAQHHVTLVDPNVEVVEAINRQGIGFLPEGATNQDQVDFVQARAVREAAEIKETDLTHASGGQVI